jgi:2-polyprenyl-3-methyl-5-hydroxy-6-metoxy-1,4-benzoquinol methylase
MDRGFWEERWAQALQQHGDRIAQRPPNAHLTAALTELEPGRALDAGCGHGSDTFWLAARGWNVTALDFSRTALARARATAVDFGLAERIEWVEGDLASWTPEPGRYDLVVSLYVHMAAGVEATVRRLAAGVVPGGTLFLVGHRDAPRQVQVSVDEVRSALGDGWELLVAEDRPRPAGGVDAVIHARNLRRGHSGSLYDLQ